MQTLSQIEKINRVAKAKAACDCWDKNPARAERLMDKVFPPVKGGFSAWTWADGFYRAALVAGVWK